MLKNLNTAKLEYWKVFISTTFTWKNYSKTISLFNQFIN
jgi:hypothetical protein